jgi:hypothetical protein
MATPIQVVIDCADPARLAAFWAEALGYQVQPPPPGFRTWEDTLRAQGVPESEWNSASAVVDPDGTGPRIYFQRVPEAKQVKNRLHLDLRAPGGQGEAAQQRRSAIDAEVERLSALDATVVAPAQVGRFGEYWVVMADPEGNEFCVH